MGYVILSSVFIALLVVQRVALKRKSGVIDLDEVNLLLKEILETNFRNNSLSNAAESILLVLKRFYSIDYVTIFIKHEKSDRLDIIASNIASEQLKYVDKYANNTFKKMGSTSAKVLTSSDGFVNYASAPERGITFSNFTPLVYDGVTIGAILLENKNNEPLADMNARMHLYDKIFKETSLVLQNVIYTENLISLTSTDQLTGVYNRRYIDMTLGEQLSIHRNLGMSFSVALFDIDHFKKFNDTYGHPFGDLVLKEVANFMKDRMGENCWVARYGGEEFVLFFGRSNPEEVYTTVDNLRQGLSELQISDEEQTVSITASFGIATFPSVNGSVSAIVRAADDALYDSKKNGRNRVTIRGI